LVSSLEQAELNGACQNLVEATGSDFGPPLERVLGPAALRLARAQYCVEQQAPPDSLPVRVLARTDAALLDLSKATAKTAQ
jgi:hypothetical protein